MPNRVIRETVVDSESLSRCSVDARLLFVHLVLRADDYGRLDGRPLVLLGKVAATVPTWDGRRFLELLVELATCDGERGPIQMYEVEGRPYIAIRSWEAQRGKSRRARMSRYPAPPVEPTEAQLTFADARRQEEQRLRAKPLDS